MVQPWPTTIPDPAFPGYSYPSQLPPSGLSAPKAVPDEFEHTRSQPNEPPNGTLTLPQDFWPNAQESHELDPELGLGQLVGLVPGAGHGYGSYEHSMFDAMIHDSQCA